MSSGFLFLMLMLLVFRLCFGLLAIVIGLDCLFKLGWVVISYVSGGLYKFWRFGVVGLWVVGFLSFAFGSCDCG